MKIRTKSCSPSSDRMVPPYGSSSADSAADEDAEAAREQADQHRGGEVERAEAQRAVLEQANRLVVERRIRGEPAHHAGGQHQAEIRRDHASLDAEVHDDDDQERTERIDDQRSVRK